MARDIVLGIDSSTQSTKVLALDLATGEVVGEARAPHSGADLQDPRDWWTALVAAVRSAVTPEMRVCGLSVAGQQHGLVTTDASGTPLRSAPLWNNVDAAEDAERLNQQADFALAVGSRLVAAFTIAKLAHLARTDPDGMARTAMAMLPHDWLNLRLTGELTSDRGDASGSGWWSPGDNRERRDLLALAVGDEMAARLHVPTVRGAGELAGLLTVGAAAELGLPAGIPVGPGSGDNMGAALGIGAEPGELVVSLGTSGTAYAVSDRPTHDPTGEVCGFADASGRFLPLVCMLNCTRVVGVAADLLGLPLDVALDRAGAVEPGADGLLLMPYLAGERTPNLPQATGSLLGIGMANMRPEHLLRASLDGVAAGLSYCLEALARVGVTGPSITLVGGGSAHPAWQQAIADVTGLPVQVRGGREHVARGAAIQVAAILAGQPVDTLARAWRPPVVAEVAPRSGMQAAFALDRRRAIIAAMREAGA